MELLRGSAAQVSATSRVTSSGTGSSLSVSTIFITDFSIGKRQSRLSGREPPVVNDGDHMVVAGEEDRSGIVEGICYVNVTRGAGNTEEGPLLWKIGGVVAFILAALLFGLTLFYLGLSLVLGDMSSTEATLIAVLVSFTLTVYFVGRWLMRRGQRISKAIKMIHEASSRRG